MRRQLVALIRLSAIDDHPDEAIFSPDKEDAHLGLNSGPIGDEPERSQGLEEGDADRPLGSERAVPVRTDEPAFLVDVCELLHG